MRHATHVPSLSVGPRRLASIVLTTLVVVAAAVSATGPAAAAGSTTRASVSSSGAETPRNTDSTGGSISADGRFVAFLSVAPNLVDGDTNGVTDVFVRDRVLAQTKRVSVGQGGVEANGHSFTAQISADGRHVAFQSGASNLVAGDSNGVDDAFVRDLAAGVTTRVNVGPGGTQASQGWTLDPHLSADGRYVSMTSFAPNLVVGDTNSQADVFVHDRQTQVTSRVSVGPTGAEDFQFHAYGTISDDGRWVAYHALVPFAGGQTSIYLHDRAAGTSSLVGLGITVGVDSRDVPSVSSDGRYITWHSDASTLVPGDTNNVRDVFVRDRLTGATTRVSVDSSGVQTNGQSRYGRISGNGRYVTFASDATNLRPDDNGSTSDVFLHDRVTGVTSHVSSGPNGPANANSSTGDITDDGRVLSYQSTGQNLVPGDTNNALDVFVNDRGPAAGAPPVISVDRAPASRTNDRSPAFAFSASGPVSFECSFAAGSVAAPLSACTSPLTYSDLADGAYVFSLHAYNQAGSDRETISFTVDTAGPGVTFTQTPASYSRNINPRFSFVVENGATLECSLSIGADAFSPCVSPVQYAALPDGAYTFQVRATDVAGNTGSARAHPFTIDTIGPVITIDEAPLAVSNDMTPTVDFSSDAGATFECRLSTGSYEPCVSPITYSEQSDGQYTFTARAFDSIGNLGQPRAVAFTIDTVAPVTTLGEVPPAVSGDSTPSFVFGSESGATFECSLSSGADAYSPCTSPAQYTQQPDGAYTFKVRATDLAGNTGVVRANAFTIDTGGPATTIDEQPPTSSRDNSPTFQFSSEAGAVFECSLSTGAVAYSGCSSPLTYTARPDGAYTFTVRATDGAGNAGDPVSATFTIDRTGPVTTIHGDPPADTDDNTPTFSFSAEAGATFECARNFGDFYVACTSPFTYDEQPDGQYVFLVRAADSLGNTGSPAAHAFTIDTTGPITSFQNGPTAVTGDNTPTFEFSSEAGVSFECSLSPVADSFEACTSPVTYPEQPDGTVTFKVIATDTLGNAGPVTQYTFRIDATTPTVTIEQAPSSPSSDSTPSFSFSSDSEATFECSLSTGADAYAPCSSPRDYLALADDGYMFKVRATDSTGNIGAPAEHAFTIDTSGPAATISQAPPAQTGDNTPTFEFTSEPGATFECSLSSGTDAYSPCTSPRDYPGQADGTHTFKVRATDAAGNTGDPARYTIAITTAAAPTACATATNVITGTNGSNTLRGTTRNDVIDALAGNDAVTGLRGNDCVRGGTGADDIKGNAGNDELVGGDQNDKLAGGAGRDVLSGGDGIDRLYAVDGEVDQVDCGAGANEVAVVDASDVVVGCEVIQIR